MRTWSIPAGTFFGVEVRIHWTFLFLLGFVLLMESAGIAHAVPNPGAALALVGIILVSVVLHEIGHAVAALHGQARLRTLILLPIGGIALMQDAAATGVRPPLRNEIRVAIAGPLTSLLIALVAGAGVLSVAPELGLWARPWVHTAHLMRSLVWVNFALAVLNLLPAYPLDGGRILRAVFARGMDYPRATRRVLGLAQIFAVLFFFLGIWNLWFTMIGFFIFVAAQTEQRSVEFQTVLETVRMEDIMLTEFSTLSPADTLEHALSKAVHTLQDDFPVVRGNDMVGVISRQRILDALRLGGNAYVQSVMNRAYEVAHRSETLGSAFQKITARGLNIIPVVEGEHLVGIVTLQNLMHSMAMLAESRKLRRLTGE